MENKSVNPPQELREAWEKEFEEKYNLPCSRFPHDPQDYVYQRTKSRFLKYFLISKTARWAADQEFQKCFDAIRDSHAYGIPDAERLRGVRDPDEMTLKQKALKDLCDIIVYTQYPRVKYENIRLALESLPNE